MEDSITYIGLITGATAFLLSALIAFKNYVKTQAITGYWGVICVVSLLAFLWSGSLLMHWLGFYPGLMQQVHPSLALSSIVGYTVSVVKAVTTDAVIEVV